MWDTETTRSRFRQSLEKREEFTLTFELVPSRGGRSRGQSRLVELARQAAADGRIRAVSITENAGGHPALSPEVLGLEIRKLGLDVISHFSCKDKNRNQIESLLFAWDREGLHELLVLTGDYPKPGFQGAPKPVFDLDCVHLLHMIREMNRGNFGRKKGSAAGCILPTDFHMGVALSPFKRLHAELAMQYAKLLRKRGAGADYVITQVGYDARKFEEVLLFLAEQGLDMPVLGNVFVPSLKVAGMMHRGEVPGCSVPRLVLERMAEEARMADNGQRARLMRAGRLLAVLKGLGYSGAHIGGPGLSFRDLDCIMNEADRIGGNWREAAGEFLFLGEPVSYLFLLDHETGFNHRERVVYPIVPGKSPLGYRLARSVHNLAFSPEGALYGPARRLCLSLDETCLKGALAKAEHVVKLIAFGCQNCGDCALAEHAFLCPQSGCAKYLLNGPCGGSHEGWCEVYPGKRRCHFVQIHERLSADGETERLGKGYVPPRNWELNNTSSWVNFYRGLDHTGGAG